jgi:hypothetical protein
MEFTKDLLKPKTAAHKELLIIIISSIVVLVLAVVFDVFDRFVYWYVQQEEPAEIEEIIIVVFLLSFAFAIFSWRRWRELVNESQKREKVEALLREESDMLKVALSKIKTLTGLLPICSSCKKIRDDKGFWTQLEVYVCDHSEAEFSHAVCPDCTQELYPEISNES